MTKPSITSRGTRRRMLRRTGALLKNMEHARPVRSDVLYLVLRSETGGSDPKPRCIGIYPRLKAYERALADIIEMVSERSAWQLVEDVEHLCAWDIMHERGFEWSVEPLSDPKKG